MCRLCAYWLGYSPRTFYRVYTIAAAVLFTARFVIYRRKKWHYYFLDFCYWANGLLLVHIWFFPESVFLHKVWEGAFHDLACTAGKHVLRVLFLFPGMFWHRSA